MDISGKYNLGCSELGKWIITFINHIKEHFHFLKWNKKPFTFLTLIAKAFSIRFRSELSQSHILKALSASHTDKVGKDVRWECADLEVLNRVKFTQDFG